MTEREQTILDLTIWAVLIYLLALLVLFAWRRFIKEGDVITEAKKASALAISKANLATARANRLIAQRASIDSFVTDWMEPEKHSVHIAEAMYLTHQRSHPKKGRR